MVFEIQRSQASLRDLEMIFDHLVESYIRLGETETDAVNFAVNRLNAIRDDMNSISRAPFQGTLLDSIASGLRSVTKSKAIFYFVADADEQVVRIMAAFFGGQDHRRHMVRRLGMMF
jgi:toxin ParE1/3/4